MPNTRKKRKKNIVNSIMCSLSVKYYTFIQMVRFGLFLLQQQFTELVSDLLEQEATHLDVQLGRAGRRRQP